MKIQRYIAATGYLLAILLAVFQAGGIVDAQPAANISTTICATVTLLEGEAIAVRPSLAQQSLVAGETLCVGDRLQTSGSSKVELTLVDNNVIRLNEGSTIDLAVDVRNAEKRTEQFQVKLLKGEIWVTLLDQTEGFDLLQVLVAGALLVGNNGVFRAVLYQDGAAEIKVYAGYVTASGPFMFEKEASRFLLQPLEDDEMPVTEPWRYRIEPYRKIIIQASGKETKPFRFTARADLSDWVRWNQLRDADIR